MRAIRACEVAVGLYEAMGSVNLASISTVSRAAMRALGELDDANLKLAVLQCRLSKPPPSDRVTTVSIDGTALRQLLERCAPTGQATMLRTALWYLSRLPAEEALRFVRAELGQGQAA